MQRRLLHLKYPPAHVPNILLAQHAAATEQFSCSHVSMSENVSWIDARSQMWPGSCRLIQRLIMSNLRLVASCLRNEGPLALEHLLCLVACKLKKNGI